MQGNPNFNRISTPEPVQKMVNNTMAGLVSDARAQHQAQQHYIPPPPIVNTSPQYYQQSPQQQAQYPSSSYYENNGVQPPDYHQQTQTVQVPYTPPQQSAPQRTIPQVSQQIPQKRSANIKSEALEQLETESVDAVEKHLKEVQQIYLTKKYSSFLDTILKSLKIIDTSSELHTCLIRKAKDVTGKDTFDFIIAKFQQYDRENNVTVYADPFGCNIVVAEPIHENLAEAKNNGNGNSQISAYAADPDLTPDNGNTVHEPGFIAGS